ncbi:MAG: type II toxin-antitoxin system VapC family toxin [Chlorobi bacterium]|nr:type II toxin-antitoxin system VapC family toxin [Chlorobiota bacterium]
MKYIWDTNTVIYYLQQQFPPKGEKFIDNIILGNVPVISVITEVELLCWKTTSEKDLQILRGFIEECRVLELDTPVKYKTAEIRKHFKLKLPDAIIAATATLYDLELITRNVKDFKKIEGLTIINPFELD